MAERLWGFKSPSSHQGNSWGVVREPRTARGRPRRGGNGTVGSTTLACGVLTVAVRHLWVLLLVSVLSTRLFLRYMCSPMSRPRALIFDLDGLLIDSEPTWFVVEGSFLAELGHTWTREDADSCMGQGTPNTLRIWQQRFGVKVDIARDTELIVDRMIARASEMPLKPGARELVSSARAAGLRLAVASSSPRRLIEAVLRATKLDRSMDAVVSGQEVPRGKPAPDVFLRAAELLGVEPAACVVLEDALAGVKAARAANMRVLAVPTVAADAIAPLATWVMSDLHAAIGVLGV